MEERKGVYFVADVHLGLRQGNPADRESRFLAFLKGIPRDSKALWLLGDIWDFWYEYKYVIPRCGARVLAELINLMDAGVEVCFIEGNHDIWTYSFFEQLGMKKFPQPHFVQIDGKTFCLGHGDGIGGEKVGYKVLNGIFHSRFLQFCFTHLLHPNLAFAMGTSWSGHNRRSHGKFVFSAEREPSFRWALEQDALGRADYYIFGHYHCSVREKLPSGAEFFIVDSWLENSPYLFFDGQSLKVCP